MKKDEIKKLIAEYLQGTMSSEKEEVFKELLEKYGYNLSEITEMETIYRNLEELTVPEPGEKMHTGFYSMLEDYKRDARMRELRAGKLSGWFHSLLDKRFVPQLAYSLALLLIGWMAGFWLTPGTQYKDQITSMSTEIQQMREVMMLTMLEQPSASDRMKAVNLTNSFENVDDEVVYALLKTLNNDRNVNVRLVTVEALFEFADNPKVREGLIQSIAKQESPLVQLALADVMVVLQEKNSVEKFNELLKKVDLNDTVRSRIERSVEALL